MSNKKSIITFFVTLFTVAAFLFSGTAFAQTESFSFNVSPKNPEAYSSANISISSFSVDLDRAYITWNLDGSLIESGTGETNVTIQTKGLGEVSVVKVRAVFATGEDLTKTLVIQPSGLDILWEAVDSYTPPFYKGKALPAPESTIKALAVPEIKSFGGRTYNPESLIYTWKKGGETQQQASGYNKQYFSFKHDVFNREPSLTVEVKSQDGISSAQKTSVVSLATPKIAVYEEDSKKGILFGREVSNNNKPTQGRVGLVAVPYFFSVSDPSNRDLSYEWKINDRTTNTTGEKNSITIEKASEEGGFANIELSIGSVSKLFQESRKVFNLELR